MGIFDSFKSLFKKKKKYKPETLTELKKLVNNPEVSLKDIDISQVTSFEGLFENCLRTNFSGIENWDVSHVTNMKRCFYMCPHINNDISSWDVSNVKDASQMFAFTFYFDQNLSTWNFRSLKEPFNGAMASEMFKGAHYFQKRLQATYQKHLEKGEQPEKIFKRLPLPVPKDYDKLMLVPKTDRDVGNFFERIDDLSKLDTSAVTKLDNVLKNSKRTDFEGIEELDLNNVKTAKNFLAGSKIDKEFSVDQSTHKPKMENVVYADGMLKDTTYNEELPSMPKIKVIDGLMENNPVFNKPIDPIIKDSELVSVNNAFNAISKPVIEDQEILKTEQTRENLNLIETNRITNKLKKLSALNKKIENISDEIHEFLDNDKNYVVVVMDPNTRDEIFSKTRDDTIRNAFVANDNLNEKNQKYQNNLNANTYVVERGVYNKLTKLGDVNNPYLDQKTPVRDAICKFELVDFAQKFRLNEGKITLYYKDIDIKNGINEELLSCENALPTLKFMEQNQIADKHLIKKFSDLTQEEVNVFKDAYDTQKNFLLHRLDNLCSGENGQVALKAIKELSDNNMMMGGGSNSIKGYEFPKHLSKQKEFLEDNLYQTNITNDEQVLAMIEIGKTLRELKDVDIKLEKIDNKSIEYFGPAYEARYCGGRADEYLIPLLNGEKLAQKPLSDTAQPLVKNIIHKEKKSYSR